MAETRPKWVDALDPTFREIFQEADYSFSSKVKEIFNWENSESAFEKDTAVSGVSQMEEVNETGPIPYEDQEPEWEVTYTHRKYAKGRSISQEMIDDNKWNMVRKQPRVLALSRNRTVETAAADIFNFGFTAGGGGKAKFSGGDSKALFATDHTNRAGTVTQSNKTTGELNQSNLESAITAMRERKDSKNEIIGFQPDTLLVPSDLEFTARVILESGQVTGSNNNDINPVQGSLSLVVWPYLTSSTAWFLLDSQMHDLNFFMREDRGVQGPTFDFDNEVAKWKIVNRFSVGFSDWKGVYGSVGDNS